MKSIDEDIKNGTFKRFYLLYGEERYLRNTYRDKLKDAIGASELNMGSYTGKGTNIREVIDLAETMPFLSDYRLILIEDLLEDKRVKTAPDELAEYIPKIPESTVIIMSESEVDKRSKLFKAADKLGGAVEFKALDEKTLTTWILARCKKEGKQITSGAIRELFDRSGADMVRLGSELEKLFSYTYERDGITTDDVKAVCTKQVEAKVFDMIDHVAFGRGKQALSIYYEMLSAKEPPMRILRLLQRQFHQLLQIRLLLETGNSVQAIHDKTKLSSYVINKLKDMGDRFSTPALAAGLDECVELEKAVKTGKLDENLSVELIIVKYGSIAGKHKERKEGAMQNG